MKGNIELDDYADFYNVLEDFKPYHDSIIWDFSNKYYKHKGIMTWSLNDPKPIPHRTGSNYQNALKLAKLIKSHIGTKSINFLECGSGSGKFARYLLFALRDLGISNQVKVYVSDYSSLNLVEMKAKNIFEGFEQGTHYEYLDLDLSSSLELLDKLEFEFIYLYYVLDALPLSIVKIIDGQLKELNIKTKLRKNHIASVFENPYLLARLEFDDEYKELSLNDDELQEFYLEFYKDSDSELYFYHVAIPAIKKLLAKLSDTGILYSCDIDLGGNKRYAAVGNSLAHPVDSKLFASYFNGYKSSLIKEASYTHSFFSKSDLDKLSFEFKLEYFENDSIDELISIEDKASHSREELERLSELSPYSAQTYFLWAKFFKVKQDYKQSQALMKKAVSMNYWDDI